MIPEAPRLTSIKINKFAYIGDQPELRFFERTNVILGSNKSGRSTLLEIIRAVSTGNFEWMRNVSRQTGKEVDIEFKISEDTFHLKSARDHSQIVCQATTDLLSDYWRPTRAVGVFDNLGDGEYWKFIRRPVFWGLQTFLTTQNPALLDMLEFETATEVEASLIICTKDWDASAREISYRNISRAEAIAFFSAYRVGIQHVSNILKMQELW